MELDWWRFYWNLNAVGPNRALMPAIFNIYRHACNPSHTFPPECGTDPACRAAESCGSNIREPGVGNNPYGVREGAELNYGLNSLKYKYVTGVGFRLVRTPR